MDLNTQVYLHTVLKTEQVAAEKTLWYALENGWQ